MTRQIHARWIETDPQLTNGNLNNQAISNFEINNPENTHRETGGVWRIQPR
ncbi:hypothetical protein OAG76_00420 [Rubripirellula sp.]|nr:hypothetical protein [Rubripirellula sp.]